MDDTQWRTHRLELDDQTLREWDATVLAAGADGIVLDRSAFYPGGGGQPPDHGVLLWGGVQTQITGARKGDDLYLIPAEGEPQKLVHKIESGHLDRLPGKKRSYAAWQELFESLKQILNSYRDVAMQYSPKNEIPYVSMVDAGTIELVRSTGTKIISSADLVQKYEAVWSPEQLESHLMPASM